MPLARSACRCGYLMRFVFPFQPRDTPAARASRLLWMISILSIPLGKYSALPAGHARGRRMGFFPSAGCNVGCGDGAGTGSSVFGRRGDAVAVPG